MREPFYLIIALLIYWFLPRVCGKLSSENSFSSSTKLFQHPVTQDYRVVAGGAFSSVQEQDVLFFQKRGHFLRKDLCARIALQLRAISGRESVKALFRVGKPSTKLRGRRYLLSPSVEPQSLLAEPARPQPVYQYAIPLHIAPEVIHTQQFQFARNRVEPPLSNNNPKP